MSGQRCEETTAGRWTNPTAKDELPTECSASSDLSVKSDSVYNRGSTGRTVRREVMLFLGGNFLGAVSTMDGAPGTKQGM